MPEGDFNVTEQEVPKPLALACERVGMFLYYFSPVEMQLDAAITTILKLAPRYVPIITQQHRLRPQGQHRSEGRRSSQRRPKQENQDGHVQRAARRQWAPGDHCPQQLRARWL